MRRRDAWVTVLMRLYCAASLVCLLGCHQVEVVGSGVTADAGRSVRDGGQVIDPGLTLGCRSSRCPAGQLCDLFLNACREVTSSQCGARSSDAGLSVRACNPLSDDFERCVPGLVCAPDAIAWERDGGAVQSGKCMVPCDPCAPACAGDLECVTLPGRGGFCNPGALATLGELCLSRACAGPLSCSGLGGFAVCTTNCLPDDPAARANQVFGSGSVSRDCGPGQVCAPTSSSIYGNQYQCVEGVIETGELCGPVRAVCRYPAKCDGAWVCSPDCSMTPCPVGLTCFTLPQLGGVSSCIRDGVMLAGFSCAAERNCAAGLTCQSGQCRP